MKILFVTNDRSAAQLGAQALHGIAPNGAFTWTQTPASALRWLQANRDAAAVIIEAERQPPKGPSFVDQVHSLGLATRVVAVPAGRLGAWLTAQKTPADRLVVPRQSNQNMVRAEQAGVLSTRHASPRSSAESRPREDDAKQRASLARAEKLAVALQRRLLELEAALDESRRNQKTQELAAADRLARRERELDAALALAAASQAGIEQRLAESKAETDQVRQRAAVDSETASLRERALENRFARQTAAREDLERSLAAAQSARADADRRSAIERAEVSTRLADLQMRYDAVLRDHAMARIGLEQQLADARAAKQELASQAAAGADRESALEERLARETSAREALEQNLANAEAARVDADRRHTVELAEAAARLADLQYAHTVALTAQAAERTALERQVADGEAARQALVSQAAAGVDRESALEERLARETSAREALEQNLAAAEAARTDADRRHTVELAEAAARLADLQHAYATALSEQAAARTAFEQQLADAGAARQALVSQVAAAADRESALEDSLAQEIATRVTLERSLTAAEAARTDADRRHTVELAEAAARLADLQHAHTAALSEQAAARRALEQQLADAEAARQALVSQVTAAAHRVSALEKQLAGETSAREALEQNLAAAEAARVDADRRHAIELAEAAARLADLQHAHTAALTNQAAERSAFEQQLVDAEAARQTLGSQVTAAADRESALEDSLAQETAARVTLERSLAAAEAARVDADRRHTIELAEAAARLADLQHAHAAALTEQAATRAGLEQRLTDAAAGLDDAARARRRLLGLAASARRRHRDQIAQLEGQVTRERVDAGRTLAAKEQEVHVALGQIEHLNITHEAERQEYERGRLAGEAELERLKGEYEQARLSLDHLGISYVALERVAGDNALERARLESVVAERDAQLRTQMDRYAAAERASAGAIEGLRQELQAARSQAAALRGDAERAPVLQKQLDESEKEGRRLFERAPYGLCRFVSDGAFIKANHSFARLLGYRKVDDIRSAGLGMLFECAADLRWLIEQAAGTGSTQTIETSLKTKNGRRVDVRLHALSHADGTIDVAVQDLTAVRALEARLREAQRMEAVGRVASEVAVTCDMVLRDVTHGGREWLAAVGSDPGLRQQGELLLGEVTRAAGFLRQFSVYGRQQISALAPVSVQRVIRDLAPVLKRVAGDDIDWVLPKTSGPIEVDVDAERVERVLVNVAGYARERMPQGGRIKIDVTTTVLGRDFIARYPDVRPGAHALITIAEMKGDARTAAWAGPHAAFTPAASTPSTSERTGVDLGALLALLGDCGGHLWIAAERSGNMTLKVHLPRRVSHGAADSSAPVSPTHRVRQLAGWFRH